MKADLKVEGQEDGVAGYAGGLKGRDSRQDGQASQAVGEAARGQGIVRDCHNSANEVGDEAVNVEVGRGVLEAVRVAREEGSVARGDEVDEGPMEEAGRNRVWHQAKSLQIMSAGVRRRGGAQVTLARSGQGSTDDVPEELRWELRDQAQPKGNGAGDQVSRGQYSV